MKRLSYRPLATAVATAAFALCYADVFASLVETWSTHYLYSYGFAVPLIAAYIVWTRSHEAPASANGPDYVLGVPVTAAGLVMLAVGRIGTIGALEQISLVVTLTGLLLLLYGRRVVRHHWFAIGYLLLMIPIWTVPIGYLQDPSRILSTKIAVSLIQLIGVPVLRQGTNIILPTQTLSVLLECSGVNQLVAVTAMVLPAAYLWLPSVPRRITLITLAVAISYLANGFRIALVGWLAVTGLGDGDLNGPGLLHLLEGLGVSALGYLAIGACFSLLSRSSRPPRAESLSASPVAHSASVARRVWLDVTVVLLLLVGAASNLSAKPIDVGLSGDLGSLESRIDDWTIEVAPPAMAIRLPSIDDDLVDVGGYPTPTGERRFLAVDDELVRVYRDPAGNRVRLYIGYYRRQDDGRELTDDAGAALAVAASTLTLSAESRGIQLNEIVRTKNGLQRGVLFWYDINGRVVSDFYRVKSYTIWDAMTRGRTNGAVVMIGWEGSTGIDSDAARQRAIQFADALMPLLRRHLPS